MTVVDLTEAQVEALTDFAREDLATFARLAWPEINPGVNLIWGPHNEAICVHLEAVTRGEIKRLLINVPPGSTKTTLVCQVWPVWEWLQMPALRWGFAAYGIDLSARDSVTRRRLIQSEWYQRTFAPLWSLQGDQSVKTHFDNDVRGTMKATSVGGAATGFHYDRLVTDDPLKPVDIYTARLEQHVQWYKGTWASRMRNPQTAAQVVIMQRLHDRDLCGVLLREMEAGTGERWEHLCMPMRYVSARPSRTSIGWRDWRRTDGELLCPGRWSGAWVDAKERSDRRVFAAQYQQAPKVDDGTVFRESWVRYYHLDKPIEGAVPYPGDAAMTRWVGSWDFTFEGGTGTDWNVGGVWARRGADIYLRDRIRERMEFTAQRRAAIRMARKWPEVRRWLIEKKANGAAVLDTLRRPFIDEAGERDNGLVGLVPVVPKEGKIARAHAVTALFEGGHVYLPHPDIAPWVPEYVAELVGFPTAAHDDQVDMTTQALADIGRASMADDDALDSIAPPMRAPALDLPAGAALGVPPAREVAEVVEREHREAQAASAHRAKEMQRLAVSLGLDIDPGMPFRTRTFGRE